MLAAMRAPWLLALCLPVACGAATDPLIPDQAVADAPSCQQAVAANDASAQACVAATALLSCPDFGGAVAVCISDNGTCNGSRTGCMNQCRDGDEYAVACDGQLKHLVQPPAGCQAMEGAPNGTVYYCCPCAP